WDYQWGYSCILREGWAIIPNINMVSNIGFGEDATHTHVESDLFANMRRHEMDFPMKHPDKFFQNSSADDFTNKCRHSKITRFFLRLHND
ncbi:glycosyltransferase family 2 protein, partial [Candidatus Pacearchaeota archaeon]|nr:glycosyltransferase family 2 protein [Candidatus Pacearchaeota archaeon]